MGSQRAGFGGMPDSVREPFGREALRQSAGRGKELGHADHRRRCRFFARQGGCRILQPAGAGVLFDVNLDAVNQGHLKLSSRLLSLARHVLHHTESGKN